MFSTIGLSSTGHTLVTQPENNSSDIFYTVGSPKETNLIMETCRNLSKKYGIYSVILMKAAGFEYTDVGDTAKCEQCQLIVSGWATTMKPFDIHAQRSPNCVFVRSIQTSSIWSTLCSSSSIVITQSKPEENPSKRQKLEVNSVKNDSLIFSEIEILKQARRRTFSHWSLDSSPSAAQMIDAGFFYCNVADRVICLYCNLICQQWAQHTDNPCEIHKTLSPKCPFVMAMIEHREVASILIVNTNPANNRSTIAVNSFHSNEIVPTTACNIGYIEISKREASFTGWPEGSLPSVEGLVRAGFFYSGTKTITTCFYCNGSLQNWGSNDNPMIEHARWFPNCQYAKQLCGDVLHRRIKESKRAQQERVRRIDSNSNNQKLQIPDEMTLSRLVAARLDLPVSQQLLNQHYKLSIVKRCWEDQLRLKHDDFEKDSDLLIACTILQRQIDHINGNKENIIVPSVQMQKIHAREHEVSTPVIPVLSTDPLNSSDIESSQLLPKDLKSKRPSITGATETKIGNTCSTNAAIEPIQTTNSTLIYPCSLCMSEEKCLACIPCGHLATCVPCGHSLRTCPICRQQIDAFVRVYI